MVLQDNHSPSPMRGPVQGDSRVLGNNTAESEVRTRVGDDIDLRGMVVQILLLYAPFRVMHRGVRSAMQRQPNPEFDLIPLVEIE